jgi:hypothetical protein
MDASTVGAARGAGHLREPTLRGQDGAPLGPSARREPAVAVVVADPTLTDTGFIHPLRGRPASDSGRWVPP